MDKLQGLIPGKLSPNSIEGVGNVGGNDNAPSGGSGGNGASAVEEKRRQEEEMKQSILTRILDNNARERLGRIALVKPEKARGVESMLISMARTGKIQAKVGEDDLLQLLERISDSDNSNKTKIVFNRRQLDDESEEEEYDF
ncbi:hypothetical protein H4219_000738 [Mycoemilia scoparia]|uniref:Programmed cell death protein 5 n=1 Tax=Mycoemilia scoparia TaxID=417184 RepID=A0A9W8DX25_9FUNG|nr:hypothetical protein H4219_000738 [Mycoemilia scoparia]